MENRPKKSISQQIEEKSSNRGLTNAAEKIMPKLFLTCAVISILTTIGIVVTLMAETFTFFSTVSIVEFVTSPDWYPVFSEPDFGIRPLIIGTLMIAVIAMVIAIPIGLAAAIFLSEYASDKTRRTIKPILEVLAGIPTIVYGFFALTFVTPVLQNVIPGLGVYNALSPGLVVGIMIIPMVASLSEDAMSAVPGSMREGAYALGSTRLEVAMKVVVPAALSGILASFVLAISRAIGETMIVTVAGGANPTTDMDITNAVQTMTAYIVQVSLGDVGYGTTTYYSIYAVGMTLFLFTLLMNVIAYFISKRFREVY
ncbi:phosphate ABC transporter membrane protein 1 (PhoT family) [Sinobaca qinghaiensis]|uniref:Phosphate transport system permease protein n=1 Tax=Sinobaca qinghaiensis TaxID=342944 RepID=A0A419V6T8_9BACL|nr:phosphate ABC transporter membrane protein 1 (PhoT family) [Sinobaca qinghaiensis]